ncbi:hypothetical protein, partial [Fulvivirga lutimaris]|uniref:hypothetical protein n=1 Tax=Fulvivirga lutimaris TaxID=1819566 RepID=UPI0016252280
QGAIALTDKDNWCSPVNAYTTVGATGEQSSSCASSIKSDVWFKFQASTSFIDIEITNGSINSGYRVMKLMDGAGQEIGCMSSSTSKLVKEDLIIGDWYYMVVGSQIGSSYNGTFTLCINDIPSNDYKIGEIDLSNTINEDCATYTNVGATGSQSTSASGCSSMTHNDTWYKFQAKSEFMDFTLTTGSLKYAQVVLKDSQDNILMCNSGNSSTGIVFNYISENMVIGEWYYLIVGNSSSADQYEGTFEICMNDVPSNDYKQGAVEL